MIFMKVPLDPFSSKGANGVSGVLDGAGGAGSPEVMAIQVVLLEFHRRGKEACKVILDIN